MVLSSRPTHELIKACVPTRPEKARLARALGLHEATLYKWCEDPDGSGRPNPLDKLEVILDHARVHHPTAALAIETRISAGNARALSGPAPRVRHAELLVQVQPQVEKETTEALGALSRALRELVMGDTVDLRGILRELEEAEREISAARIRLAAAIEADETPR